MAFTPDEHTKYEEHEDEQIALAVKKILSQHQPIAVIKEHLDSFEKKEILTAKDAIILHAIETTIYVLINRNEPRLKENIPGSSSPEEASGPQQTRHQLNILYKQWGELEARLGSFSGMDPDRPMGDEVANEVDNSLKPQIEGYAAPTTNSPVPNFTDKITPPTNRDFRR